MVNKLTPEQKAARRERQLENLATLRAARAAEAEALEYLGLSGRTDEITWDLRKIAVILATIKRKLRT
jgi:hypothetical protein